MTIYGKEFIFKLLGNLPSIDVLGGANSVSFFMQTPELIRNLSLNEASFLMRAWDAIPARELMIADDQKSGALASNLHRKGLVEKRGRHNGKIVWTPTQLTAENIQFIRDMTYFVMI